MNENKHGAVMKLMCEGEVGWKWVAVRSSSMMIREMVLGVVV